MFCRGRRPRSPLAQQRRWQNGSLPLKYSTAFTTLIISLEWLLKVGQPGKVTVPIWHSYHVIQNQALLPEKSGTGYWSRAWIYCPWKRLLAQPASYAAVHSFTSGRGYSRRYAGCQNGDFVWGGHQLVHETADPVAFRDRLLEDRATGFNSGPLKMQNRWGKEARFPK